MGLALPLRRCAGLSVLGLEVFRSPSSSSRSENRLPSPSLSSGATPEYDHSRQSIDPRVRPRVAPTLSGPYVARWRTAARIELSIGGAPSTDDPIRRPNHSMQCPTVPWGRSPKRLHHPKNGGPRSRHEPEGPCRTAPSDHSRPKPEAFATEPPRVGVASHRRPLREPAGVELAADNTQVHERIVVFTSANLRPALRRKPVVVSLLPLRM